MPVEKKTATVLRQEEKPYIALSRETIDSIQNADALAVWIYLQAKPNNWNVCKADIMKSLGLGKVRYKNGMDCLKEIGLITTACLHDGSGRFQGKVIWCHAEPISTEVAINGTSRKWELPESGTLHKRELPETGIHKDIINNKRLNNNTNARNAPDGAVRVSSSKQKPYRWQSHPLPDWIPLEAWKNWMVVRLKKGAVNTERSLNSRIVELDMLRSLGYPIESAIDEAADREWKSIRDPDWLKKTKPVRKSPAHVEYDACGNPL